MDTKKQSPTEPQKKLHVEIIKQLITLSTSGFGVVAALAWNGVIQEIVATYIKPYLAPGSGIISLLIYAIGITILAVAVTYNLTKIVERIQNSDPK